MKSSRILAAIVVSLYLFLIGVMESQAGEVIGWGTFFSGVPLSPAGKNYVAIDAGSTHNLALKADGSIIAWGIEDGGILDYGQVTDTPTDKNYVVIAAGDWHNLALKTDGSIVGWGRNDSGQATPPAGNDYTAIAAGDCHSLALRSDGSIVGWGCDSYGQATAPAGNDYVAIAAGLYHNLALKTDGTIIGWGYDNYSQASPPAGNDYVAIAAGDYHSLALKTDGSIVGWGRNDSGEVTTPLGKDYVAIAAGHRYSLAIKTNGSIIGWGIDDFGQATPPAGNDYVDIVCGSIMSLALKAEPMGTAFMYQGRLTDADEAADGLYDFQFQLFNSPTMDYKAASSIFRDGIDVIDGFFSVELDFGTNVFNGNAHWLEIGVRPSHSNDPNSFVTLSPRQKVTPAPYAVYAKNAEYSETAGYAGTAHYAETAGEIPGGISGSGTSNYIAKFAADTNTIEDSAIYESSGNVGIGTTSPYNKLEVEGAIAVGSTYSGTNTAPENGMIIEGRVGIGTTSPGQKLSVIGPIRSNYEPNEAEYVQIGHGGASGYVNWVGDGNLDFRYENVTLATVAQSGKIGIGTTSPGAKLDVTSTNSAAATIGADATTATGIHAVAIGARADANSHYSIAMGTGTKTNGWYSTAIGTDITVSGRRSVGIGIGISDANISQDNVMAIMGGKVGVGTTEPDAKLDVETPSGTAVMGETGDTSGAGVLGIALTGNGVYGFSQTGNGVYGEGPSALGGYAGYFQGNVYVTGEISAQVVTDRTPYPEDLETAYQAVMSMERLPDAQHEANNKQNQLDHSKLSDFIRSQNGSRDLSATVSCLNEVVKDLIRKNREQRHLVEELAKANIYIGQLHKHIDVLEQKMAKLETRITDIQ